MKLVEKLKEIGSATIMVALIGTLAYITGHSYCTGIRSMNDLKRTLRDAERIEHVIQKEDLTGNGFRSLRKKYFLLEKDEFKAIDYLNDNYNYKENVATNMWLDIVIDENDIPVSILGAFINKPYKIKLGDIIKVPKR